MKKRARARMRCRRDRFVVGYISAKNPLFSNVNRSGTPMRFVDHECLDPMSLVQARRFVKTMPCANCAIFELVPVEVNR